MICETCKDGPPLTCGECCGTGQVNVGGGGGVYADPAAEVLEPCGCDDGYLLCPDCGSEPRGPLHGVCQKIANRVGELEPERQPPDLARRPRRPCGCGYALAEGELLCAVCASLADQGTPLPRCDPLCPEHDLPMVGGTCFACAEESRVGAFEQDLADHAARSAGVVSS